MHKHTLASLILAAILAGCAGPAPRESATEPLALVVVERQSTTAGGDCTVVVTISNRIRNTTWEGASYHLSLRNRAGKHAGRLLGAPRQAVAYGRDLADSGRVLGVRCEDIGGADLVYLGYYASGKTQQNVHLNRVRLSVK